MSVGRPIKTSIGSAVVLVFLQQFESTGSTLLLRSPLFQWLRHDMLVTLFSLHRNHPWYSPVSSGSSPPVMSAPRAADACVIQAHQWILFVFSPTHPARTILAYANYSYPIQIHDSRLIAPAKRLDNDEQLEIFLRGIRQNSSCALEIGSNHHRFLFFLLIHFLWREDEVDRQQTVLNSGWRRKGACSPL